MSVIDLPDEWGFCGCTNESALIRLRDIMRLMDENRDHKVPFDKWYPGFCERRDAICPGPLWELMMHFIEHLGWGEHGGGINSSWLNGKGAEALKLLEGLDLERLEKEP